MLTEGIGPRVKINVPSDAFVLVGFEVTLYGRFWVTPEGVLQDFLDSVALTGPVVKELFASTRQITQLPNGLRGNKTRTNHRMS